MKQVCRVGNILVGINCVWTLFFYTWNFYCIDGSLSFNITTCPNNSGPLKKLWETLRLQIFTYWSRSRYFLQLLFIVVQSVNGYNVLSCSSSSLSLCHCQHHWMLCAEKHRGFAFVEFELAEDAAAAIDNLASSFLALYYSIIYGRHYLPIFAVIC